jgi:nitrate reductase NapE component
MSDQQRHPQPAEWWQRFVLVLVALLLILSVAFMGSQ